MSQGMMDDKGGVVVVNAVLALAGPVWQQAGWKRH